MKKIIISNFKMNTTPSEMKTYSMALATKTSESKNQIIVCPPFTHLCVAKQFLDGSKVSLGAQNVSSEEKGAFTGEVSASMLKDSGVEYVIVGHSERRTKFKETDRLVNKKIKTALANGLKVILCIGEDLASRQAKQACAVVKKELDDALKGIYENELEGVIIAYEPIWAIGTGKTATLKDIQKMVELIRKEIAYLYSDKAGQQINVVYGGSIDIQNYKKIISLACLNGALIGGASLNVDNFAVIARENYWLIGEKMEHISLYRKYRPKTFDEVIGQEHITKTLQNQIMNNHIGHAYLFTGTRGTGKTSVAKIFARAVNCLTPVNGSPCGKCENCLNLQKDNDINIIEMDAASNNKVDDVREIREKVKFLPVGAKYKVYIIDEVHMLTDSAFNALLKTLEEPPEHIIFILATTEAHKLPQTILSRCVRFDFHLVSVSDLMKHLAKIFDKENIKYDEESLKLIATAGEGSVRDTLSIADSIASYCQGNITKEQTLEILGTTDYDLILSFFKEIKDREVGNILSLIDKIEKEGKNLAVFAKDLSKHARNLLVCKTCKDVNDILNLPNDVFEKFKEQADLFEEKDLIRYMQVFSSAENELRYTLSVRLLLETTCLTAILGLEVKKNWKLK